MAGQSDQIHRGRLIRYRPLPSQRRFHDIAERFKGFSGPVGAGKSAALCNEALRLAFRNPGRTGLIGAPTYNMLRDATLSAFLDVLSDNSIAHELNRSSFTLTIGECASRVLFRSLEEYERLRGTNLAWFGVDELTYCAEEAWLRLEARLRDPGARDLAGFGVWTPKGFDWVYRRFLDARPQGYGLIQAVPFENRHILEATPDYYERLESSYDEAFYRQEVLGGYLNLQSGQVYCAFDRTTHIGAFEKDSGRPLIWSWDFNVNPMASVVCQRKGERLYVIDEICLKTSSTPEVCSEFLRRYGGHRAGVTIYGDASGGHRHTAHQYSDFALIQDFVNRHPQLDGAVCPSKSNPPVRERINMVNAQLMNAAGEERLYVDRHCEGLIRDLEQVTYKAGSGMIDKSHNSNLTHLSDALGYLVWQEMRSSSPAGEMGRRIF